MLGKQLKKKTTMLCITSMYWKWRITKLSLKDTFNPDSVTPKLDNQKDGSSKKKRMTFSYSNSSQRTLRCYCQLWKTLMLWRDNMIHDHKRFFNTLIFFQLIFLECMQSSKIKKIYSCRICERLNGERSTNFVSTLPRFKS